MCNVWTRVCGVAEASREEPVLELEAEEEEKKEKVGRWH